MPGAHKDDRRRFFQSLSLELEAKADQVRFLIGDRHWLTDGHHKEALLQSMLRRLLPGHVRCTRGFVLGLGWPEESSTEQDLLLVDSSVEAPIFSHGDLSIVAAEHVLASCSVKTTFKKQEFVDSVAGLVSAARLTVLGSAVPVAAVYFFNPESGIRHKTLENVAKKCVEWLNNVDRKNLPKAREWCFRISRDVYAAMDFPTETTARIRITRTSGLSTALFLASVCDGSRGPSNRAPSALTHILDGEVDYLETCEETLRLD